MSQIEDSEEVLELKEAARLVQKRFHKKRPPHVNTIRRWILYGMRDGRRLEPYRAGGTLATTRQALERFFRQPPPAAQQRNDSKRLDRLEAELIKEGF